MHRLNQLNWRLLILAGLLVLAGPPSITWAEPPVNKPLTQLIAKITPIGWTLFDEVREFTPENLYLHINGRADFYIAFDVTGMTFAGFVNRSNKGQYIELYIYDMGTPTNAFGVFSTEKSSEGHPLALGRKSYQEDANYFVWQGQYYIRIIVSDNSVVFKKIAGDIAQKVTTFLPDSGQTVWGLKALPIKDRVPESLLYIKVNALGVDFMRNTYMAKYNKEGTLVLAFISKQDTPEIAAEAVTQYVQHTQRYGERVERLYREGVELTICDMDNIYDVLFLKGNLVGGVSSVEDRGLAIRSAIELWQGLLTN